jgi:hypothetical protein
MYLLKKLFTVIILTLSLSATFNGFVAADPPASSNEGAAEGAAERVIRKGQELRVPIIELHPTQFRVGFSEVARKEHKLRDKKPHKLEQYIEEHKVPVVVGPDGKTLYMTDYHHRMTALLHIDEKTEVIAHVVGSYPAYLAASQKSGTQALSFAKWMVANNYAYLKDKGVIRAFSDLPEKLGHLRNDAYRSLVGKITDDEATIEGEGTFFAEFKTANWLRKILKLSDKQVDGLLGDPDSKESTKFLSDVSKLVVSEKSEATCIAGRIREHLRD